MATAKATTPKAGNKTAATTALATAKAAKAAKPTTLAETGNGSPKGKAAPQPPETAPPAAPKAAAKKQPVERDHWGNRVASKCATINAAIGTTPQSVAQIVAATNQVASLVRAHLYTLINKGFVEKVDGGYRAKATK